jgi:molybdenum cofactor cytidylyltransferase
MQAKDRTENEMLLEHALRVTREAGFHPVFVVLGAHAEHIQRTACLPGCTILINPHWQEGMASSIRCGVQAVMEQCPGATGLLLLVCDQPALSSGHLRTLLAAHCMAPESIVASRYADHPGVPILAPRSFFPSLLALTGDHGAREILRAGNHNLTEVPFANGEWDVDLPEDISENLSEGKTLPSS